MAKAPLRARDSRWYGWLPDRPDHRDFRYAAIRPRRLRIPKKIDLSAGCSKIEDQGALGSCTANALVGALEFLERRSSNAAIELSRLFVYYNERALEGTVNEDNGAFLRTGIKSLAKQGVCAEKRWPYTISRFKQKPSAACYREAMSHQILSYHRIATLTEMKSCLAEGFPFVFGFTVYADFESARVARTGVLNMPKASEDDLGGHAVMAVGYDDAKKRLLVRNSWGPDWGVRGYFTMPYAYVENRDLSDDFWTVRAME